MSGERMVVLLDDQGVAIGSASRETVHSLDTPLHLAFSCHLIDAEGNVLLTRRSLTKRTWPGVWTNSFCGHPQPGEDMEAAIRRHARDELGIAISSPEVVIDDFRYRAVDASGVVENEICPVYIATPAGPVDPNPHEVAEWAWVAPRDLLAAIRAVPQLFSPWSVRQVHELSNRFEAVSA